MKWVRYSEEVLSAVPTKEVLNIVVDNEGNRLQRVKTTEPTRGKNK